MDVIRRLFLALLSPFFVFLLITTAFAVGFIRITTHPATVKKLVADSGVYNNLVPNSLNQLKTINTSAGTLDTSNPLILQAASQAVTPQYIQGQAEAAIDNIYLWLNGGITRPNFKIDLNAQKNDFAKRAAVAVEQRLAALPACTTATQIQNFNVLNATCRPPGVTAQIAASQVENSLNASDFLSQANISTANITNPKTGQSVFDQKNAQNLPKLYQWAKKTPFILSILAVLCGLSIVFLSRTWQAGLRQIGINLAFIGVLMLAFSFFMPKAVSRYAAPRLNLNSGGIKLNLSKVANDAAQQINQNYWFFGGLYTIAGAGAIIGSELRRRKSAAESSEAGAAAQHEP